MSTAWIVFYQSADSYHSLPTLPQIVFVDKDKAIEYAKSQPGYGYETDWFVQAIEFVS